MTYFAGPGKLFTYSIVKSERLYHLNLYPGKNDFPWRR